MIHARKYYFATEIKLASILTSYGIPRRESDPITCEIIKENGKEERRHKFWFDISDKNDADKCHAIETDFFAAKNWETLNRDAEDPLYWMKGALENRDALVHEIRNQVSPMEVITVGDKTVIIGHRLSEENKKKLKNMLR